MSDVALSIFIDFDGVLNPCNFPSALNEAIPDLVWEYADRGSGVCVSRSVWDRVVSWCDVPGVEVNWLSTWNSSKVRFSETFDALGFVGFDRLRLPHCGPWEVPMWKTRVVAGAVQVNPVVWIDDEISWMEGECFEVGASPDRLLRVEPSDLFGLSVGDLDRVDEFIGRVV